MKLVDILIRSVQNQKSMHSTWRLKVTNSGRFLNPLICKYKIIKYELFLYRKSKKYIYNSIKRKIVHGQVNLHYWSMEREWKGFIDRLCNSERVISKL